ncbi:hypothetical protein JCM11641_007068 [Rhodosporidiobolus odoratus]
MSRGRPPSSNSTSNPINQQKILLLKHLTLSSLSISPPSAIFYAERLAALDPASEPSTYLVAYSLVQSHNYLQALWHLRQPITFLSTSHNLSQFLTAPNRRGPQPPIPSTSSSSASSKLTRTAIECSLRCARLYADTCAKLGRAKEGREVLARVLQPGTYLVPSDPASTLSTGTFEGSGGWSDALPTFPLSAGSDDPAALDLELARLAKAAGDAQRAIISFRKVLERVPTCWEAIQGLCDLGAPPDVEALLPMPVKKVLPALLNTSSTATSSSSQTGTTHSGLNGNGHGSHPPQTRPLGLSNSSNGYSSLSSSTNGPPPLGPSQTASVNTAWANPPFSSSGGLFTPGDASALGGGAGGPGGGGGGGGGGLFGTMGAGGAKGKGKEVVGLFGVGLGGMGVQHPGLRRTGSARLQYGGLGMNGNGDVSMMGTGDLSAGDDSSFDTSFYPAPQTLTFSTAGAGMTNLSRLPSNGVSASSAGSLFTPPAPSALPTATAPGVKRTRAGNIAPASMAADDDHSSSAVTTRAPVGRRTLRGVPDGKSSRSSSSTVAAQGQNGQAPPPPTRRSSRLSANAASSAAMAPSRSSTSANGGGGGSKNASTARDKKRSKASAGPSVLSDSTSTTATSSSPGPSSPPSTTTTAAPAPAPDSALVLAKQEAEEYVLVTLRGFAKIEVALSGFEGKEVVEGLVAKMGKEQAASARALRGVARARVEAGEYEEAAKAFTRLRQLAPCSFESMDLFSTTLWHLRSPTSLSFLAQDLHSLSSPLSSSSSNTSSTSPEAWIASGNVFSHLDDHPSALRCFKRAAQIDETGVYAYVLAGHECVLMEEWEKSLGFFREAVRRDIGGRGYNAWFGLGNVYLKTGKYTLAEYHFRRALEINPNNVTLVCCVGTVLEKLSRPREALEMYERACSLAPDSALARFKRVRMAMAFKRWDLAEQDLLHLRHVAPTEPNVHYLLGRLYKQLGPTRKAEMARAFMAAQDLEPSAIRDQMERPAEEVAFQVGGLGEMGSEGGEADSRMSDA